MLLSILLVEAEEVTPGMQLLNLFRVLRWIEPCHIVVCAWVQKLSNVALNPIDFLEKLRHPLDVVRVTSGHTISGVFDRKRHHQAV